MPAARIGRVGRKSLLVGSPNALVLADANYRVHINIVEVALDPTKDDNSPLDAAFLGGMKSSRRGRPKLDAPKVEIKVRLDADTVAHLRGSGPGWQTRVNALLGQLVAEGQI